MQLPRASGWRVASDLCDTMPRSQTGVTQFVRARARDHAWGASDALASAGTRAAPAIEPAPLLFGGVNVHHFGYPVELQFMNHTDRSSVPSTWTGPFLPCSCCPLSCHWPAAAAPVSTPACCRCLVFLCASCRHGWCAVV